MLFAAFRVDNVVGEPVATSEPRHFLSLVLDEIDQQHQQSVPHKGGIRPIRHFVRVNNMWERLFSRTKLVMTDNRKVMDSSTLETLFMLRMNKELWDERDMKWTLCIPRFFDSDDDDDYDDDVDDDGDQAAGVRRPRDEDNDDYDVHSMMTSSTQGDLMRQCTTTLLLKWLANVVVHFEQQ